MGTSINYGGFWFHIEWKGDKGTDQHGRYWLNRQNPEPANGNWLKGLCGFMTEAISTIGKYSSK